MVRWRFRDRVTPEEGFTMGHDLPERCDGCGLIVAGGSAGCQLLFDDILAIHFSSPVHFAVHRLSVDTYALQHPERYCVSFKSMAAHLAHLCWSLERDGSRATPSEQIRRWVERHPHLDRPDPPASRGRVTIEQVVRADAPAEHHRAVDRWARDTWAAYGSLQSTARHWVDSAYAQGPGRSESRDTGSRPARRDRSR